MPRLSRGSSAFLWIYENCILKTSNEAVVEGMCKFISKQADTIGGLSFQMYAIGFLTHVHGVPFTQFTSSDYTLTSYVPQICKRGKTFDP